MTKPADDKLGHAKQEIKALTGQLAEAREDVRRCEKWRAEDKEEYELLEVLVESCSKRNESDCDLIDSLQEQVAELEASAVVPSGVWQFYFDGEWTTGMNTNDHRANTKAAGFLIRDLWLKQEPTQ
jgi:archaellum component FlaC